MASAEIQFGQIPFEIICRFGELDKTEIRLLSYLYACRNEQTKQCNPSRKKIVADTGIAKTHLSNAIAKLEKDGWLLEDENGFFTLNENPPKREKVTESVTQKVTENVTKVTESVTKSYGIGNSLNKDLNRQGNRQRTDTLSTPAQDFYPESWQFQSSPRNVGVFESEQQFIPRSDALANSPPVLLYESTFKVTTGNAFAEMLDKTVTNLEVWEKLILEKIAYADETLAKRNGISKWILTAYAERLDKLEKNNGSNQRNGSQYQPKTKRTDAENFAEAADFYAEWEAREKAANYAN